MVAGNFSTLPKNHDDVYCMGDSSVTFCKNGYTVAIAFATIMIEI
jgi:hypothetical protein